MKVTSTVKKEKVQIRQDTDIDGLSIPEEKSGTKRHSGAFPKGYSPKLAIEMNSIQMEFDDNPDP